MSSPQTAVAVGEIRAGLARKRQTQEQLASHLGMSRTGIYRRLAGDVDFSVLELSAVAAFLDVSLPSLLTTPAEPVSPEATGSAGVSLGGDAA